MLNQFMKERSHFNAKWDYSCSLKSNMNAHVKCVHERKKLFKCDICDYSCSLKSNVNTHVESVHGGKKPITAVL